MRERPSTRALRFALHLHPWYAHAPLETLAWTRHVLREVPRCIPPWTVSKVLVSQWGYLGLLVFVLLGNLGLPVPEESVLSAAGYLVWQGGFQLPLVLRVGIVSVVAGDSLGYWVGRRYGQPVVARYGLWARLTPPRLETMRHFVQHYGPVAVFLARFVIGLRFLAGPLAGSLDLP